MKTRIFTLFLIFAGTFAFAQQPEWHFPEAVSGFDSNASWFVNISINGELQTDVNRFEIAAFIGDQVRSREFYQRFPDGHDYACMTIMALVGETRTINFKLFDHETNQEFDGICLEDTPYEANAIVGGPVTPYTLHFVTPATCTFTNFAGNNWSTATNWSPRIPASCDDAIIAANSICVIDEDATVAYKTLTIKDGAQFFAPVGSSYTATVEKEILAYTGARDHYYFISSPVGNPFSFSDAGILNGTYDFYYFDQTGYSEDWSSIMEWQNYESYVNQGMGDYFAAAFKGYLYANAANTTLSFSGNLCTTASTSFVNLAKDVTGTANFPGFNLVGNPYACNAAVSKTVPTAPITGYYTMNSNGSEVVSVLNPIVAPCSALFVVTNVTAPAVGVVFTPTTAEANARYADSFINVELVNQEKQLFDRAYIKFGEGENLQKFTLNADAPHVFFREESKDFANIYANDVNQLPLYFTTREYGEYTINVKLENMNCEYLHLIDNITGADIDLNATPSYTFRANQGDYACRFKLVFEGTGVEENNANVNFAIVEGNRIIIPMIEHESTLEIIDMTGRTISSQKVNGSFDQTLNVNAGIYLLRMNGNVQKIVVR